MGFLNIKIKYFDSQMPRLSKIAIGDRIDLRAAEEVVMKAGEFKLIPLGVAMKLPRGHEAVVSPRGSTFKNYGIIQTNSIGVIDESFCGPNDQWFMPVYALRDTVIPKYDRVCQFRIQPKMAKIDIIEVKDLDDSDRGSHGSTGVK